MSTSWYKLRAPVARLVEAEPVECTGAVYSGLTMLDVNGLPLGILFRDHLQLISSNNAVALRWSSGRRVKVAVYANGPDDEQAISDAGQLTTLGDLRKLALQLSQGAQ